MASDESAANPPDGGLALESSLAPLHAASFGWALACCSHDPEQARDVLQTAYLKALDGRARFDGDSSLRTWFFGVIRHTAAERRRRRLLRGALLSRWLDRARRTETVPTPEQLASRAEAERDLRSALNRLSRRQREVLHLVFYQELTLEQAAEVMRLPVGTVRTHYARGKARLHRSLTGAGEKPCTSTTLAIDR